MDERAAIDRVKSGDIDGLAWLVRAYQAEALRAANLITRDRAMAEDVVQDGFIQAWDRIETFDASRPFGPWFRRLVINLALKAVKRQSRHVVLNEPERSAGHRLIDTDPEPDEFLELIEQAGSVREALDQLSPDERAAIVLRYYGGFTDREAADRLGRPPGTIKWWLHSARKRLRDILTPQRSDERQEERS